MTLPLRIPKDSTSQIAADAAAAFSNRDSPSSTPHAVFNQDSPSSTPVSTHTPRGKSKIVSNQDSPVSHLSGNARRPKSATVCHNSRTSSGSTKTTNLTASLAPRSYSNDDSVSLKVAVSSAVSGGKPPRPKPESAGRNRTPGRNTMHDDDEEEEEKIVKYSLAIMNLYVKYFLALGSFVTYLLPKDDLEKGFLISVLLFGLLVNTGFLVSFYRLFTKRIVKKCFIPSFLTLFCIIAVSLISASLYGKMYMVPNTVAYFLQWLICGVFIYVKLYSTDESQ